MHTSTSTRDCRTCGKNLPLSSFHRSAASSGGRRRSCKSCRRSAERRRQHDRGEHPRSSLPKECFNCRLTKPAAAFHAHKHSRDGLASHCIQCTSELARLRRYGLTAADVRRLHRVQRGLCPPCQSAIPVGTCHVDHDHATGAVRGLLCSSCNLGIGNASDSPETLDTLALYLEQPPGNMHMVTVSVHTACTSDLTCNTCQLALPPSEFHNRSDTKTGKFAKCKSCRLASRYGVQRQELDKLLIIQQGTCGGCRAPLDGKFNIDHDHETAQIRGLLCKGCNTALGHFEDDSRRLRLAAAYLRYPPTHTLDE